MSFLIGGHHGAFSGGTQNPFFVDFFGVIYGGGQQDGNTVKEGRLQAWKVNLGVLAFYFVSFSRINLTREEV
jgi:hypothetical protein